MAKGKPAFSPTPVRAMADEELTALDHRVLQCVGYHDRLSTTKGSRGCYASNATMAAETRCTITSLSRVLSRLVAAGYIERDRGGVPGKRHLTIYRVQYDSGEHLPHSGNSQLPDGDNSYGATNPQTLARDDSGGGQTLAREVGKTPYRTTTSPSQETSLREGIDVVETREETHLKMRASQRVASEDQVYDINAYLEASHPATTTEGLGEKERVVTVGSELARFERVFKINPHSFDDATLDDWAQSFVDIIDADHSDTETRWAQRLLDGVELWQFEHGRGDYAGEAA